jgi:hypothetical protein
LEIALRALAALPNRQGTTNLIMATAEGLYVSSDDGRSWQLAMSLTAISPSGVQTTFFTVGMNLFAGFDNGDLYRSTDAGLSWTEVSGGLAGAPLAFAFDGANLIVGTGTGVFFSRDVISWVDVNVGLGTSTLNALAVHRGSLYGATNGGGLFLYTNGLVWKNATSDLGKDDALAIVSDGADLFVGTNGGGVYRSTDDGTSWNSDNNGLMDKHVTALAMSNGNLYAGTWGGGIFRSSDKGSSWVALNTGLDNKFITSVCAVGTRIFAGTRGGGVFFFQDNSTSWSMMNRGLTNLSVHALTVRGTNLLAGTSGGVFVSTNNGADWTARNNGLTSLDIRSLAASGTNLVAGTNGGGVFLSTDDGSTWTPLNNGLATFPVNCLAFAPNCLVAGTSGGAIRWDGMGAYDADVTVESETEVSAGTTFTVTVAVGNMLPLDDLFGLSLRLRSNQPTCTYVDGSAADARFPDKTAFHGFQKIDAQTVAMSITKAALPGFDGNRSLWKAQFRTSSSASQDVTYSLTDIVAMNSIGKVIRVSPGILKVRVTSQLGVWPGDCNNDGSVNGADVLPIGLYYGQSYGGQNIPGMQWRTYTRWSWPGDTARKMVYADANGDGLVNSTDVLPIGLNYGRQHQGTVGKVSPSAMIAPQDADGVLVVGALMRQRPNDTRVHVPILLRVRRPVYGIAFNVKYAGGGTPSSRIVQLDTSGTMLSGGLMVSRISEEGADVGMTRIDRVGCTGEGRLMDLVMEVPVGRESEIRFEICNVTGNDADGRSVSIAGVTYPTVATSVDDQVPLTFGLQQNYPNPFNPTTSLEFGVPSSSFVRVSVFDMLGREVATLVDGDRAPGRYLVHWNASTMSSGVYYYRMTAHGTSGKVFSQTRQMVVVK